MRRGKIMSLSITSGAANVALRQLSLPQVKEAPPPERLTTGTRVAAPVEEPRESLPSLLTSSINPLDIIPAMPDRNAAPVGRPAIEPVVTVDRETGVYSADTQSREADAHSMFAKKMKELAARLLADRQSSQSPFYL
jgi:hypothetical protein